MAEDLIRYDVLTQEALRGMIARILDEVARTGLPGEHHFFITFETTHPGVRLSLKMRERYPEEMTIVIQHRFWDLAVRESGFEIGLSFDDVPEKLHIPFSAIKGFYDPSVKFGLQFDLQPETAQTPATPAVQPVPEPAPKKKDAEAGERATSKRTAKPKSRRSAKPGKDDKATAKPAAKDDKPESTGSKDGSAEVVSLDSFRKKK